jgi:hypothetical protein
MAEEVERVEELAHRLQARSRGRAKVAVVAVNGQDYATLRVVTRGGAADDLVVDLATGTEVSWLLAGCEDRFDGLLVRLESGRPPPEGCAHDARRRLTVPVGGFVQCGDCRLVGVLVGGRVRWAE